MSAMYIDKRMAARAVDRRGTVCNRVITWSWSPDEPYQISLTFDDARDYPWVFGLNLLARILGVHGPQGDGDVQGEICRTDDGDEWLWLTLSGVNEDGERAWNQLSMWAGGVRQWFKKVNGYAPDDLYAGIDIDETIRRLLAPAGGQ